MGSAGNLGTHQGSLGVEHVGIDLFQGVPAVVVVAVAGGGGEAASGDPIFLHGPDHLGLVVFGYLVNGGEPVGKFCQPLLAIGVDRRGNSHGFIQFQQFFHISFNPRF